VSLTPHYPMEQVKLALTADILRDQLKDMATLVKELRKGIAKGDWFMVEAALAQLDEDIATWRLCAVCDCLLHCFGFPDDTIRET